MAVSLTQFVEYVSQSGLVTAGEVSSYTEAPPDKRPKDAQELAKALIRDGKLTKYQAQVISQGKSQTLMFGEYTVLDRIGAGGMGVVLKAQHRRMKRLVAIKVLPAAVMKNKDAIDRFYREVEAAAKLIHPNIVAAFDAGEHQGMHYLVMEFVDGRDLASVVAASGVLPIAQAVDFLIQAAKGLEFAHAMGVVHRDIKPGNLLLSKTGQVKILDMGLARFSDTPGAVEATAGPQLTNTGQMMGTVDYMSPEQAMDTRTADHRADIYALGCTLFKLLTGQSVYDGDTMMKKLMAHREQPVPSLRAKRPEVPESLDAVFQRMMAKRPEDRYQSMSEVIAALGAFVGATGVGGPSQRAMGGTSQSMDAMGVGSPRPSHPCSEHATPSDVLAPSSSSVATKAAITAQPTLAAADDTITRQTDITNSGLAAQTAVLSPLPKPRRKPIIMIAAISALAVSAVLGGMQIIKVSTGKGDLVIETSGDGDVEVAIKNGGVKIHDVAGKRTYDLKIGSQPLPSGEYRIELADDSGLKLETDKFTIERNGTRTLKAWIERKSTGSAAKALSEGQKAGDEWDGNGLKMKFCWCPAGDFKMAGKDVKLTRGFWMAKHEVTQAEYTKLIGVNPSSYCKTGNNAEKVAGLDTSAFPVDSMSWNQAVDFCRELTAREREAGRLSKDWEYRLPTEAQWEYACRARSQGAYSFGDNGQLIEQHAWIDRNSGFLPHEVGKKLPNAWGLHDMHGNVWEWCRDWNVETNDLKGGTDPEVTTPSKTRAARGGGFRHNGGYCAFGTRNWGWEPDARDNEAGFRLALVHADSGPGDDPGFVSIFDGKTLAGWDGDEKFWSVQGGVIVGQTTPVKPTANNTFLIWKGGKVDDFELRLRFKIANGNSGIQYRSEDRGSHVVGGYQADVDATLPYNGSLYEELGRGMLAERGQKIAISATGEKKIVGKTLEDKDFADLLKKDDWNEYVVIAQGNHLVQQMNGRTTVDVIDNQQGKAKSEGVLALQIHRGPPMMVEFKDILLKKLGRAEAVVGPSKAATADPDRRAAEWALSRGGIAFVSTDSFNVRDIKQIADLPPEAFNLMGVEFNGKPIADDELAVLRGLKRLSTLTLRSTDITDKGLGHVMQLESLGMLFLEGTKVTSVGLARVATLKKLQALGCPAGVTDAGVKHIGELKQLRTLFLDGGEITGAGLAELCAALPRLEKLALNGCSKIVNDDLVHLQKTPELREVLLDNTNVSDKGVEHLGKLKKLKSLYLSRTKVTDDGLKYLQGLDQLGQLLLTGTGVTKAGVERFGAVLPNCKVTWDGPK